MAYVAALRRRDQQTATNGAGIAGTAVRALLPAICLYLSSTTCPMNAFHNGSFDERQRFAQDWTSGLYKRQLANAARLG
jgi:hypothetical protein